MSVRIGVDVGGTFTDLVAERDGKPLVRLKVATTPRAPEEGLLEAVRRLLETSVPSDIISIAHASTIATNALLGQMHLELPRVAFITTEGFRDVLEIGRQNRSAVYDLSVRRPKPLARREDRLVVRERIEHDGNVTIALDRASLERAIGMIREREIATVAVGFLNSYANDAHERAVELALGSALPNVAVTRSAALVGEEREYERFSTAVVNAALLPVVRGYLERLEHGLRALGVNAPVFVMQSNGGTASLAVASARPSALIESGPASGVIAAASVGKRLGLSRVLSFDMGGTTAKAGTVIDGRPEIAFEFEAAGATHSGRASRGSGYPVRFPFVDLAEVSAGGGTIAAIDAAGSLRVGPLSAGADPGPACYGRGTQPTVTDANVVLGRLNPVALVGGSFPIDARRAHDAVASIASVVGGDVLRAAAGIVALVDADMAKVLRIVSVERGLDPRDFALMAFGGGGPLHACALADDLGMRRVVVPEHPGLFSAYGLLDAEVSTTLSRSFVALADEGAVQAAEAAMRTLARDATRALVEQGVPEDGVHLVREFDMHYRGQSFDITVPYTEDIDGIVASFHERHERRYGYAAHDEPVEIAAVRVLAAGVDASRASAAIESPSAGARNERTDPLEAVVALRDAHDGTRLVPVPVYARERLRPGDAFDGPAIVEQYDTTTWVAGGWSARIEPQRNLILER